MKIDFVLNKPKSFERPLDTPVQSGEYTCAAFSTPPIDPSGHSPGNTACLPGSWPQFDNSGGNQSVDWSRRLPMETTEGESPLECDPNNEPEGTMIKKIPGMDDKVEYAASEDQVFDGFSENSKTSTNICPTPPSLFAMSWIQIVATVQKKAEEAFPYLETEQVGNNALISDNFSECFAVSRDSWLLNESQGRRALGIPLPNFESNKAAYVAYFKALEFGFGVKNNGNSLSYALSRRIMKIWLHLFFQQYVQELEREEAAEAVLERNKRQIMSVARDSILIDVYGSQYTGKQQYRNKHLAHELCGHRWWEIASYNGKGVVPLASKGLDEKMYLFFCSCTPSSIEPC